jgi:hypothetical protein
MLEILKPEVYDRQIRRPLPGSRQLWENVPILHNPEAFTLNPRHNTHSAGLPQPDSQHQLDIDCWAQYALLHGHVGSIISLWASPWIVHFILIIVASLATVWDVHWLPTPISLIKNL